MQKRIRSFLAIPAGTALILALVSCYQQHGRNSSYAYYETKHFGLYFDDDLYTGSEIEDIGAYKERLLSYIEYGLGEDYDGFIVAYLATIGGTSYVDCGGNLHESRQYVLHDDGHEIVHAVAADVLGKDPLSFLQEGLAVALALDTVYEDPVDRLWHNDACLGSSPSADSLRHIIENGLLYDRFEYTWCSYQAAGAFVYFLMQEFGLAPFKEYYSAVAPRIDSTGATFFSIFKQQFGPTVNHFIGDHYLNQQ